jgi:hypothetical protein
LLTSGVSAGTWHTGAPTMINLDDPDSPEFGYGDGSSENPYVFQVGSGVSGQFLLSEKRQVSRAERADKAAPGMYYLRSVVGIPLYYEPSINEIDPANVSLSYEVTAQSTSGPYHDADQSNPELVNGITTGSATSEGPVGTVHAESTNTSENPVDFSMSVTTSFTHSISLSSLLIDSSSSAQNVTHYLIPFKMVTYAGTSSIATSSISNLNGGLVNPIIQWLNLKCNSKSQANFRLLSANNN